MITMSGTSLRAPHGNLLLAVWILLLLCFGTSFAKEGTPAGKALGETSKKKLIGVWESPDTTRGGLGAIYEFRNDGGLMAGMGALVNMTYDPQDPNLQQLLPNDKTPDVDDRPQKITDGPVGSAPYVGVWKFRHYTGGYAYQQITTDGRIMLRVPFPMPWGRYEVKGKKLRIIRQGCPPVDVVYKVTDKTLDLTAPGKKTQRLIRVVPTWYHALTESEAEEAKIRLQQIISSEKERRQPAEPDEVKTHQEDTLNKNSWEQSTQKPIEKTESTTDAYERYRGIKGIVLKNGNVIEGRIISWNRDIIKIRTKDGKILSYDFKKDVKTFITR